MALILDVSKYQHAGFRILNADGSEIDGEPWRDLETGIPPRPPTSLTGARCCLNCEHWAITHEDEEGGLLGTCALHPGFGTLCYLYCDDFAGRLSPPHLGGALRYPEAPENGGPMPHEKSANVTPYFKEMINAGPNNESAGADGDL